eukprot:jgi/Botrbrau1/22014/Bobra.0024s0028.1
MIADDVPGLGSSSIRAGLAGADAGMTDVGQENDGDSFSFGACTPANVAGVRKGLFAESSEPSRGSAANNYVEISAFAMAQAADSLPAESADSGAASQGSKAISTDQSNSFSSRFNRQQSLSPVRPDTLPAPAMKAVTTFSAFQGPDSQPSKRPDSVGLFTSPFQSQPSLSPARTKFFPGDRQQHGGGHDPSGVNPNPSPPSTLGPGGLTRADRAISMPSHQLERQPSSQLAKLDRHLSGTLMSDRLIPQTGIERQHSTKFASVERQPSSCLERSPSGMILTLTKQDLPSEDSPKGLDHHKGTPFNKRSPGTGSTFLNAGLAPSPGTRRPTAGLASRTGEGSGLPGRGAALPRKLGDGVSPGRTSSTRLSPISSKHPPMASRIHSPAPSTSITGIAKTSVLLRTASLTDFGESQSQAPLVMLRQPSTPIPTALLTESGLAEKAETADPGLKPPSTPPGTPGPTGTAMSKPGPSSSSSEDNLCVSGVIMSEALKGTEHNPVLPFPGRPEEAPPSPFERVVHPDGLPASLPDSSLSTTPPGVSRSLVRQLSTTPSAPSLQGTPSSYASDAALVSGSPGDAQGPTEAPSGGVSSAVLSSATRLEIDSSATSFSRFDLTDTTDSLKAKDEEDGYAGTYSTNLAEKLSMPGSELEASRGDDMGGLGKAASDSGLSLLGSTRSAIGRGGISNGPANFASRPLMPGGPLTHQSSWSASPDALRQALPGALGSRASMLHAGRGRGGRQLQPQLSLPNWNSGVQNRQGSLWNLAKAMVTKDNAYIEAYMRQCEAKGTLTEAESNDVRRCISRLRGEGYESNVGQLPYPVLSVQPLGQARPGAGPPLGANLLEMKNGLRILAFRKAQFEAELENLSHEMNTGYKNQPNRQLQAYNRSKQLALQIQDCQYKMSKLAEGLKEWMETESRQKVVMQAALAEYQQQQAQQQAIQQQVLQQQAMHQSYIQQAAVAAAAQAYQQQQQQSHQRALAAVQQQQQQYQQLQAALQQQQGLGIDYPNLLGNPNFGIPGGNANLGLPTGMGVGVPGGVPDPLGLQVGGLGASVIAPSIGAHPGSNLAPSAASYMAPLAQFPGGSSADQTLASALQQPVMQQPAMQQPVMQAVNGKQADISLSNANDRLSALWSAQQSYNPAALPVPSSGAGLPTSLWGQPELKEPSSAPPAPAPATSSAPFQFASTNSASSSFFSALPGLKFSASEASAGSTLNAGSTVNSGVQASEKAAMGASLWGSSNGGDLWAPLQKEPTSAASSLFPASDSGFQGTPPSSWSFLQTSAAGRAPPSSIFPSADHGVEVPSFRDDFNASKFQFFDGHLKAGDGGEELEPGRAGPSLLEDEVNSLWAVEN